MASSERKRQEKLAKKAAKRKQHHETLRRSAAAAVQANSLSGQLAQAATAPVHECLMPAQLFETGIGSVVLSRALPNGNIVLAVFLLDVWCLGVKSALVKVLDTLEYREVIEGIGLREPLRPIEPACARKLVEGAETYAADLGFSPHPDHALAQRIFGDIDASACATAFRFGQDGKPFYAAGPYDTPSRSRRIVEQLLERCGPGNFGYAVAMDGLPDEGEWLDGPVIDSEDVAAMAESEGEGTAEEGPPALPPPDR